MTKTKILLGRLRIIGICFCFLGGFFVATAQADKIPFVTQSKIRILAAPGETISGEITVENPTAGQKDVRLYLEDWFYMYGCSGAKEFFPAGTTLFTASPWIKFSPTQIFLPPWGKQKVSYSVTIPPNATGGRFASLFLESSMNRGIFSGSGSSARFDVNIRIATLFYIEVKGTVTRSAQVSNLKIQPSNDTPGALDITMDFVNDGNTDVATDGNFSLVDKKGAVVARGAFNSLYSFPNGRGGVLSGTCKGVIAPGVYTLKISVDLGKALAEAGVGNGPVMNKETVVTIGENNRVIEFGEL